MTNGWQNTAKAALIHLLLLKTFQETTILMLTTFSVSFLHQVFSKLYYRSLFSYDSVVNSIMSLFTQQSGNLNTVTTRLPHMHVGMHWFIWRFFACTAVTARRASFGLFKCFWSSTESQTPPCSPPPVGPPLGSQSCSGSPVHISSIWTWLQPLARCGVGCVIFKCVWLFLHR